jgi:hypothetical protein
VSMGEKERVLIEHPGVVHSFVNPGGEARDLGIFLEILPGSQRAGNQPGGIARRNLTSPVARARADIHEVIEPAMCVGSRSCGI